MKKENTALYVARLAITLLIIAAVMAAALAGVNSVTAPKIAEIDRQKTQAAIEAVLPGGGEKIFHLPFRQFLAGIEAEVLHRLAVEFVGRAVTEPDEESPRPVRGGFQKLNPHRRSRRH